VNGADPLGGLPEDRQPQPVAVPRPPPSPTTAVLLSLIGLMFLVEIWLGGLGPDPVALFRLGSLSASAVLDGDWWRLGSYAFLHAGPVHLLVNGYALWVLMRPIESLFGPVVALGIFAATAIAGGAASFASAELRHDLWRQAVGASGGIFGLFGAHCALYWRLRKRLAPEARRAAGRTLVVNLIINLALAVGAEAAGFPLDNAAHAGGFASGILLGFLAPSPLLPARPWGRPALLVLIASSFALAGMQGAAIARAVKPHPRMLRNEGVEVRVPWTVVPGSGGRAASVDGLEIAIGRDEGTVENGTIMLGNRAWSRFATTDPKGAPTVVLTTPDGSGHLTVQAWCLTSDCSDEKRDELAKQVAATAQTTP
jgi:membrane associated rhomboid family serine protease